MYAVTYVEPHTTMRCGTYSRREKHPNKTDTGTQPLEVDIGMRQPLKVDIEFTHMTPRRRTQERDYLHIHRA